MHHFRASLPKWVLTPQKETSCHIFKTLWGFHETHNQVKYRWKNKNCFFNFSLIKLLKKRFCFSFLIILYYLLPTYEVPNYGTFAVMYCFWNFFCFLCSYVGFQLQLQKVFGSFVCRVRVTQLRWRLSAKRLGGHLKKDKIIFQSALDLLFPFLPSIRFSFETLQRTLCNDGDKPSLQLYRTQVIFLWWQNLKWEKILFVKVKKLVKWEMFCHLDNLWQCLSLRFDNSWEILPERV